MVQPPDHKNGGEYSATVSVSTATEGSVSNVRRAEAHRVTEQGSLKLIPFALSQRPYLERVSNALDERPASKPQIKQTGLSHCQGPPATAPCNGRVKLATRMHANDLTAKQDLHSPSA